MVRILFADHGYCQGAPRSNFGMLTVAATAAGLGHDVSTAQLPINPIDEVKLLESVGQYDVLAMSCGVCNAKATRNFIKKAKVRWPKVQVIVGGYGPTALGQGYFSEAQKVITGSGVEEFTRWLGGKVVKTIPGVPYLTLANDTSLREAVRKSRLQGIAPIAHGSQRVIQFQTKVGCDYQCSFCASGVMTEGHEVKHNPAQVALDLARAIETFGANCADCLDLTFNSDPGHALNVCAELECQRIGDRLIWTAMLNPAQPYGAEDLLLALRAAGCFKIGVGLEALTDAGRKRLGKPGRSVDACLRTMTLAQSLGFIVRGYLIIATPDRRDRDLEAMRTLLPDLPADEVAISFATPYPGTPDWRRYQYLIGDWDYNHWDMHHPIYLGGKSSEEWVAIRQVFMAAFYGSSRWRSRMAEMIRCNPTYAVGYEQFVSRLGLG